ncbi:hypothetical protein EHE19_010710 [Ruminiclostridium herbifermentans]|uniref:Uncharacterized protein n=1 Tax=Ruminiclostridium herbifermentans TaxID=2488810 RepID=A0A4U7JIA1_9FIRM|nr:hypothetical protein [Ruminiclostridium herbifermentans]QNU65409.1 hypothetical protein EHE19_010710 [Ruminiclostridium herbifermentans]
MITNALADKNIEQHSNRYIQNKASVSKQTTSNQVASAVDVKAITEKLLSNPDSVSRNEFMRFQSVVGYKQAMKIMEEGKRRKRKENTDNEKKQTNTPSIQNLQQSSAIKPTAAATKKPNTPQTAQVIQDAVQSKAKGEVKDDSTIQTKKAAQIPEKVIQKSKQEETSITPDAVLDTMQNVIDIVGFVPGIGDIADGVNTGIYLVRKRWMDAVFSGISLLPALGSVLAAPMKAIANAVGNTKVVKEAIEFLAKTFGGTSKVASKLDSILITFKGILRKLPGVVDSIADNSLLKKILHKNDIRAIRLFAKSMRLGIETLCKKAEEIFALVKKPFIKSVPEVKVKHAVSNAKQAQSVLDGIDPKYFNSNSRFGGGFYVGSDGKTIVAELAEHGNTAKYAISYDLNLSGQKVLDLTKPDVAAKWNFIPDVTSTRDCQKIGELAEKQGYTVIKFKSYRGSGINYVIFDDFKKILSAKMVTPID